RVDRGRADADGRLRRTGRAARVVGVADAQRRGVRAAGEGLLVEVDRGRGERVRGLADLLRAGVDLDRVDQRVVRLLRRVVPRAAAAEHREQRVGRREDRRVVDLREAACAADVAQDAAGRLGGTAQRHAAPGREVVDRASAVVDVAAGDLVVRVPAVGDDLRGARDQVAAGLVAPDLAPGGVRDVVGQRDEVELALAERVAE